MISKSAADSLLNKIAQSDIVYLCSAEPTTYLEAVSLSLVVKDSPSWGDVIDYELGRELSLNSFSNGVVTKEGVCYYFAAVNSLDESLLYTSVLSSSLSTSFGNTIELSGITIKIGIAQYSEVFEEVDRPYFTDIVVSGVQDRGYFVEPWNYGKTYNADRKYPLVIYCYGVGSTNQGIDETFSACPNVFKTGSSGIYQVGTVGDKNPCFVYVTAPTELYTEDMAADDVVRVEWMIENYRIDTERIYYFGYSMGGQAAHYFVDSWYPSTGHQVAAINRNSGGYKPDILDSEVREWLHIGLSDSEYRIENIRLVYSNLKTNNPSGVEYIDNITIDGVSTTRYSYYVGNECIGRLCEYAGMGHTDDDYIYSNDVLDWVFNRRRLS